jgi:hypothetical protein
VARWDFLAWRIVGNGVRSLTGGARVPIMECGADNNDMEIPTLFGLVIADTVLFLLFTNTL